MPKPRPAGLLSPLLTGVGSPFVCPCVEYRLMAVFGRGVFSLTLSFSVVVGFKSIRFRAAFRVLPLSSNAIKNLASSLHKSQSPASLACCKSRTQDSELLVISSKVCNTSRYPPAVLSIPFFNDASKSSCGGGRCEKRVRHDRTSVLRVH